jgi:hypothetical protein
MTEAERQLHSTLEWKQTETLLTLVCRPRISLVLSSLRDSSAGGMCCNERATRPAVEKYNAKAASACAASPPACAWKQTHVFRKGNPAGSQGEACMMKNLAKGDRQA